MSRQEDFREMSKDLHVQFLSNPWTIYETGCEDGYQYAQTHPNWISVEDELPKEENLYIVSNGKETSVAYWIDNDWDTFGDEIINWMPLPQLPRKEGDEL